jgi:sugar phosphate isomerase/epimerase
MPVIEKYVKQFDIKVAIHNHGPSDKNFPTPESALKVIQKMDARVGVCMDIGHTMRAGVDPVAAAKEAGARLLDIHFKDVRKEANGNWAAVDVGEGEIAIASLMRQLEKMGYAGYCNLEHEVRGDERLPGMQKSFAYMRGVLAGLG